MLFRSEVPSAPPIINSWDLLGMGCSGVKPREFDNLLFYKEILGASSSQEIRNEIRAYYKERGAL